MKHGGFGNERLLILFFFFVLTPLTQVSVKYIFSENGKSCGQRALHLLKDNTAPLWSYKGKVHKGCK